MQWVVFDKAGTNQTAAWSAHENSSWWNDVVIGDHVGITGEIWITSWSWRIGNKFGDTLGLSTIKSLNSLDAITLEDQQLVCPLETSTSYKLSDTPPPSILMGTEWSMESCLCESNFWENTIAIIIIFNTCMLDIFEALHFTISKTLLSLVTNNFWTNQEFQSCISRTQLSPTHCQRNVANLDVCAASVFLCIAISSSWRCTHRSLSNWVKKAFQQ